MTEKEQIVYQKILQYYKNNKYMPSIRELQKDLHYKSANSIYKIINKLEEKGYLTKNNKKKKIILINNIDIFSEKLTNIPIINTKETLVFSLNKNKEYLGYKINHNYFKHLMIKKEDYLIIEKSKKLNNHDLGLFIINNQYRIMEYEYKDGFYILKDKDRETLYKVKIIGKVINIYRKKIK